MNFLENTPRRQDNVCHQTKVRQRFFGFYFNKRKSANICGTMYPPLISAFDIGLILLINNGSSVYLVQTYSVLLRAFTKQSFTCIFTCQRCKTNL